MTKLCSLMLSLVLFSAAFAVSISAAISAASAQPATERNNILRKTLATYDNEPRVNSRVDISAIISSLKDASANTYNFLIWHEPQTDYEDFVRFLEAALSEDIYVWVDITPPSEPPNPPPHGTDYVAWAVDFADLSLKYPNFVAFTIDDFEGNLDTFTPSYVKEMRDAYRAVNPNLAFIPTVYGGEQVPSFPSFREFVESYGEYIDGILLPYRDLDSLENLPTILEAAREALGEEKILISFIYAAPTSWHRNPPTLEYLQKAIWISYLYADGVMLYCLPLVPAQPNYEEYLLVKRVYPALSKWPQIDRRGLIETFNLLFEVYEDRITSLEAEKNRLRYGLYVAAAYGVLMTAAVVLERRRRR